MPLLSANIVPILAPDVVEHEETIGVESNGRAAGGPAVRLTLRPNAAKSCNVGENGNFSGDALMVGQYHDSRLFVNGAKPLEETAALGVHVNHVDMRCGFSDLLGYVRHHLRIKRVIHKNHTVFREINVSSVLAENLSGNAADLEIPSGNGNQLWREIHPCDGTKPEAMSNDQDAALAAAQINQWKAARKHKKQSLDTFRTNRLVVAAAVGMARGDAQFPQRHSRTCINAKTFIKGIWRGLSSPRGGENLSGGHRDAVALHNVKKPLKCARHLLHCTVILLIARFATSTRPG
jgi:hypothetical protein